MVLLLSHNWGRFYALTAVAGDQGIAYALNGDKLVCNNMTFGAEPQTGRSKKKN